MYATTVMRPDAKANAHFHNVELLTLLRLARNGNGRAERGNLVIYFFFMIQSRAHNHSFNAAALYRYRRNIQH